VNSEKSERKQYHPGRRHCRARQRVRERGEPDPPDVGVEAADEESAEAVEKRENPQKCRDPASNHGASLHCRHYHTESEYNNSSPHPVKRARKNLPKRLTQAWHLSRGTPRGRKHGAGHSGRRRLKVNAVEESAMRLSAGHRRDGYPSGRATIESLESRQLLSAVAAAVATGGVAGKDAAFIQKADSGDIMEVTLGQLAQTNASSQQVKAAGARMVTDHSSMRTALEQAATSLGVTPSGQMDAQDQAEVNRLNALTGTAFDEAYSTFMVKDHKKDVSDFTHENQTTSNATLKSLTSDAIPVLQQHLSLWQDSQLTAKDVKWVQDTNSGNMLGIQLGNLAQTNATSADVKAAGARMVTDHTAAGATLEQDAATLGITLSSDLSPQDQAVLNRFSKLTGSKFDVAYSAYSVANHKQDIASFTRENKTTTNSLLKTFTSDNIPVLQSHLDLWQTTLQSVRGK
jgi:putative membrane protein